MGNLFRYKYYAVDEEDIMDVIENVLEDFENEKQRKTEEILWKK